MTTTLAAATGHTQGGGWAGIVAIVVPLLIAWAGSTAYKRWKTIQDGSSSPATVPKALIAVKPQVKADSDREIEGLQAGGGEVVPLHPAKPPTKPVDQFVTDRIGKMPTTTIVNEAVARLKVSEATAWRAVRALRDKSGAA